MSDTDDLVHRIRNLSINQHQLVQELVDQLSTTQTQSRITNTAEIQTEKQKFISANGVVLSIGDRVRVLNNRKTGKIGDFATVIKFNKTFVSVQLEKNRSRTQQASKYLQLVKHKKDPTINEKKARTSKSN